MASLLRCSKINHPWDTLAAEDVPAEIFAGSTNVRVGYECPRCGSVKVEEFTRTGRFIRRAYRYTPAYKALGVELREAKRSNETRGQIATRRFLLDLGLIREPARFAPKRPQDRS